MAQTENNPAKKIIRILIADDNAPTRMLLRAAIARWGYDIVEAKDGEEAWDIMQEPSPPDLLILDWLMPKLNGIGLCKRIKSELKNFPYIILLTRMSGIENITLGLEAGADEFLSKPFNMVELQSRLIVGARIVSYKNELINKKKQCNEIAIELDKIIKDNTTPKDTKEKLNKLLKLITADNID